MVAMGILTFALVGLLALFPVALSTAADSKAETRVTLIAQGIFADVKASSFANASLVVGPAPLGANVQTGIDLNAEQTFYLSYESDGQCVGALSSGDYDKGITKKGPFIVKIHFLPVLPTTSPALSNVTVSVESPAAAPKASRKKSVFVTIKGDL